MTDCTTLNVREQIIERMAYHMWVDALQSIADEVRIDIAEFVDTHEDNVPSDVMDEACKWLKEIEEFNGRTSPTGEVMRKSIVDIAAEIEADIFTYDEEIDDLAYYCVMQYMGAGVCWTDSRKTAELKTPYGESSWSARDGAYELLDDESRKWYDVKELTGLDAVESCQGTTRNLRVLTPREHGGLDERIISQSDAYNLIDKGNPPLIMVEDWREEN
jgi:hypothetical protein